MKFIKDLGVKDIGGYSKRMCIVQCESCGLDSEKEYSYATKKCNRSRVCKSCAAKDFHRKQGRGQMHKRLYRIYKNMKTRCYNKNYYKAKHYSNRGIIICEDWLNDYSKFEAWALENGYSDDLSIDRINNDGNYEPSNCRWATSGTQAKNTQMLRVDNKTGYRGVTYVDNKFLSAIVVDNKRFNLGRFQTAKEAAIAYNDFVEYNNLEHTKNTIKGI